MSSENITPLLDSKKCIIVLLDVAGTTTSNTFLKDTLFAYILKQAKEYLKKSWEDEDVKEAIRLILKNDAVDIEETVRIIKELTEKNSDNKGLKTLQGLISKKGYESGNLKSHVFSDVPACLKSWSESRKVAIYSTGSVEAQKLLFAHTSKGDLSNYISKYFDQSVGNKTESASYEKIAKELGVKPEEIVFITDNVKEAKAAKSAGLVATVIRREGNDPLPAEDSKEFPIISSFEDVLLDKPVKRKEVDEPVSKEMPSSKNRKLE
nr:enolase-phosphatase E1-like [Leptinotarsa decemlineata]